MTDRSTRLGAAWRAARGGIRRRLRRQRFFVVVCVVAYAGASVATGDIGLTFGESVRPVRNAPWLASVAGVTAATVVVLGGWSIVGDLFRPDRDSGAGVTVAATRAPGWFVVVTRAIECVVVLSVLVGVVLGGAVVTSVVSLGVVVGLRDVVVFLSVALPAVVVTAGLIVLLSSVVSSRRMSAVVYLVVAFGLFSASVVFRAADLGDGLVWLDPTGIAPVIDSAAAAVGDRPIRNEASFGVVPTQVTERIVWNGPRLNTALAVGRASVVLVALPLFVLGAVLFDRETLLPRPDDGGGSDATTAVAEVSSDVSWLGETDGSRSAAPLRILRNELRVVLAARSRWWTLGLAGIVLAGVIAPPELGRRLVLPIAQVWPVFVWSAIGVRDQQHDAVTVIRATRFGRWKPLAACAVAVLVGSAAVGGVTLRALLSGSFLAAVSPSFGVVFFVGVAASLNRLSGDGRFFQVVTLIVWYVGALNEVPLLDVMGITTASVQSGIPVIAGLLGVVGIAVGAGQKWLRS